MSHVLGNRTAGWHFENLEAVRAAVEGYMRDRTIILQDLKKTNSSWTGYDEYQRKALADIAEIDRKVFVLLGHPGKECQELE